jgi:hypothetical protein
MPTIEQMRTRLSALKSERSSWDSHAQELSKFFQPRMGRFTTSDRNRGHRKNQAIIDSTGTRAHRILGSGILAGASSPGRPWFELRLGDAGLMQDYEVQVWLDTVTKRMRRVFTASNTYRALHQLYDEISLFGTGAAIVVASDDTIIHHHTLTWGEYWIAQDANGKPNTLYREFDMTVAQMVREFGLEKCSVSVQGMYRAGTLDAWVTVVHAIEPRDDRDPTKSDDMNMPFRSCYFESGEGATAVLRESGFRRFPVLCPRWSLTSGDVYGNSPAMEALGDVKQLQHQQLRKAQAIDYMTRPALQAPTSLKNRESEMVPGGVTYHDMAGQNAGVRPMWETRLDLSHLREDMMDVRTRINSSFYTDMFLMLASGSDGSRMTAREVAERHEEKLLMLGPVMERLYNELLEPLIDITFDYMLEAGMLPPMPDVLSGARIDVEFVSVLAQAQRQVGLASVDRFVGNLMTLAQVRPEILDRLDVDGYVDETADMLGVPPKLLIPAEQAQQLRQARDQAAAAKEQSAMMQQQSRAVGNLAQAQSQLAQAGQQNPLEQLTGYGEGGVL